MKKDGFSFFKKESNGEKQNNDASREQNGKDSLKKLSQNILRYFSAEPEKEKVLRHEDFDAAGDEYYATVSAWYKVFQRVFLVGLIFFTVVSVAVNFKYITYDNFFYLIKDFNTAVDSENVDYETLSYDAASEQSFALYRGGLAVVSRSNVSAFTATGRRTLNANEAYSKPFVKASDKYMIVYDMGDGSFAVYNSFAKIYSEKLEYPVTDACIADDGTIAVLTRSAEYESEVIIYDDGFDRVATYRKGAYAIGISLDKSGERLGVIYADTSDGVISTEAVFYDVRKHEKISEFFFVGEFPLACSFLDGGGFATVTDCSVRLFDKRLNEKEPSEDFSAKRVSAVYADGAYCAVTFNDGIITDENAIFVFDKKGELVYNDIITSDVDQLSVCDGGVFVKNSEGVLRISIKSGRSEQLSCQDGRMLVYDGKTALVCAEAKAVYLKFEEKDR